MFLQINLRKIIKTNITLKLCQASVTILNLFLDEKTKYKKHENTERFATFLTKNKQLNEAGAIIQLKHEAGTVLLPCLCLPILCVHFYSKKSTKSNWRMATST